MHLNINILLICQLLCINFLWGQQGQTVQVTVLNGSEIRCNDENTIQIQITPNPSGDFTSVDLSWGDDSAPVNIPKGQSLILMHTFDVTEFLQTCDYNCVDQLINGFCFRISVLAHYNDLPDENVSKTITYKVPPRPAFTASSQTVCLGQDVSFNNQTCPGNDKMMVFHWDFGDGDTSSTQSPRHTYQASGIYMVKLKASNYCGETEIIQTIEVVNLPEAVIKADSGVVATANPDEFTVCLNSGGRVRLDGRMSQNAQTYFWEVSPVNNTAWLSPTTNSVTRILLAAEGTYTIKLTVNNECDKPSTKTIKIKVIGAQSLMLTPQADGCNMVEYKPNPLNMDATYTLDGNVIPNANFPVTLGSTPNPHILKASLTNECGSQSLSDTFSIVQPVEVNITAPATNLVICQGGGAEPLQATPADGAWSGQQISQNNGQFFFNPVNPGTFQLVYSRGSGECARHDTVTITVQASGALQLNAQPDVCTDLMYSPTPLIPDAQYTINGTVQSNFPVNLSVSNTPYVVEATLSNACGVQTKRDTFLVSNPTPVQITAPATNLIVCKNSGPIELQASLGGGNWQGEHIREVNGNYFFAPDAAGSFTLTYTRGSSDCEQRDSVNIEVKDAIALTLTPQTDACTSLDYTPEPLISQANYTLNGSPITSFPINLSVSNAPYIVVANLTDACGVQELRDTFRVVAPTPVQITSPIQDTTICQGSLAIALQASFPDGNWSGKHIIQSNNQYSFDPSDVGTFSIVFTRGSGACAQSDSVQITVQGVELQAPDQTLCFNSPPMPLQGTPGGGSWSSSDCPECIVNNNFIAANVGARDSVEVTYNVINALGCSNQTNATISIGRPVAQFNFAGNACSNGELAVESDSAIGNTFIWQIDGQNASEPPFAALPSGMHTITQIAQIDACADTLSQNIAIEAPPPAAIFTVSDTSGCSPLIATFTPDNQQIDNIIYSWDFGRTASDTLTMYQPVDSIVFENTTDSIVQFQVHYTTRNACGMEEATQRITVNPSPTAAIGLDSIASGCSPLSLVLTNRSTGFPDQCMWSFGDGAQDTTCERVLQHTFYAKEQIENFTLTLTVSNVCGTSTDTSMVTVFPPDVSAYYNLNDFTVCPGEPIVFNDASTPIPKKVYWDFGDGSSSQETMPTHTFLTPDTTFTVMLYAYSGCGYDSTSHVLQVLPYPLADFSIPPYTCEGQTVQLTNLSQLGATYIWDFGDGSPLDSTRYSTEHIYNAAGVTDTVSLTVRDFPNGCINQISKPLLIREKPVADFEIEKQEGCSPQMINFINHSTNANQYFWDFGDGNKAVLESPSHEYVTGSYDVALVASYNGVCVDSMRLEKGVVVEDCEVFIPDAFSPNGDGINDQFVVYGGKDVLQIKSMKIFERRGPMVFAANNLPNDGATGWDGTLNGKRLNPQVFVYLIEVEYIGNVTKTYAGDVTLVR